ncbi:hypothetical protein [Aequorivita lipolytica]|uniref:Leucine-rich repeat domain-containing protein n=1 Tax=Aequorivita lipolytica TaxID=153267 RepID=A0A5C6YNB1_9FLAO|nr:hypothetical protein [Aequorivita lipolytica]TXD68539.1 hypothetical protein ESV24_11545 [Aequorivita lipolytica]SRX53312.1 hypothetical protein AEQU2_02542 [Aequorivita lipolytica]
MKLSKEEKKFWQRHFRIDTLENIPTEMVGLTSIDTTDDDEYLFYLTQRVKVIPEIYLKGTLVTDEGVAHLSKIQELKELTLRDHKKVTKASIPYFNQMKNLERLNITLTKITLSDLCESLNNQSLKEVFLSSEENEKNIEEKAFIIKERLLNCNIYLDCCYTTDSFGNIEKPIF